MSNALNILTIPILMAIVIAFIGALGYFFIERRFSGKKFHKRTQNILALANSPLPVKPKPLMSNAERSFFHVLKNTFQNRYEIFPQVTLESLVSQAGDLPPNVWGMLRNSRVDFVLAHPKYLDAVAVIELDDSSHQQATYRARDEIKDRILADAKIPLLRFRVGDQWDANELRLKIDQMVGWKTELNVQSSNSSQRPSQS